MANFNKFLYEEFILHLYLDNIFYFSQWSLLKFTKLINYEMRFVLKVVFTPDSFSWNFFLIHTEIILFLWSNIQYMSNIVLILFNLKVQNFKSLIALFGIPINIYVVSKYGNN